jgi:hypothetical protein
MHTIFSDLLPARRGRACRGVLAAVTALTAALSMSACGSSGSSASSSAIKSPTPTAILNTKHISRAIEQSIFSKRHIHAKVTCPKVVPQQKGRDFNCIATIGKNKTPFTVIQQNDSGYVTYGSE